MRGASGYSHRPQHIQCIRLQIGRPWPLSSRTGSGVLFHRFRWPSVCNVDRQSLDVLRTSWTPTAARTSFFHVAFVRKEPIMMRCGTSCGQAGCIDQWVAEFKDRFISPSSFFFFIAVETFVWKWQLFSLCGWWTWWPLPSSTLVHYHVMSRKIRWHEASI